MDRHARRCAQAHSAGAAGGVGALRLDGGPLYLSLDLDVLGPAFAPGVSHHEPGGLSVRDVLRVLEGITAPLVGADIVEYKPTRDHAEMTAAVAAKFYKELVGRLLR